MPPSSIERGLSAEAGQQIIQRLDELIDRQAILEDFVAHAISRLEAMPGQQDLVAIRAELDAIRTVAARTTSVIGELRGEQRRLWCGFTELSYKSLLFFKRHDRG